MEKELIINGVKYIKCEEPKTYKIYDLVKYNGYEWIVINVKNDKLTLMMKNCLPKEKMKEIFNNDYLDKAGDIKYSLDEECNDWNKTEIKRGLNNEFLKEFNKEELVKMKTNYDEDKYSNDYIRIPKVKEIERLNSDKIAPDKSCWLMSPSYFNATSGYAKEWPLSSAGCLGGWWGVDDSFGARPVINLKSDTLITGGIGTSSDPFVVG